MGVRLCVGAGAIWVAASLGAAFAAQTPGAYELRLPAGFPLPSIPADNPISTAKIELGRHLFYDSRLSANRTQSCASCHAQARAFTDGRARSVGSTGELHPRGSMSLVNVAYASVLTWADPTMTRLEDQALVPMYGEHPIELGLSRADAWLDALKRDERYQRLFPAAFAADPDPFTRENVTKAIATFERIIVSARSPYDRYHFDRDDTAVSAAAKRGEVLFHRRPLSCFMCHGGVHFSNAMGSGSRPMIMAADARTFKAPTLRNIALTAPYMHDGSVSTLEDAIEHANEGTGERGFTLTDAQRSDLIAFLQSLTDEELLQDPRFADPWLPQAPAKR